MTKTARARQDAIVRILRRSGTGTVAELSRGVGASRRTILRDLAALRHQGFVIDSEPGRGGGLSLDPRSVLLTARISVPEVFALVVSVASLRAAGRLPFGALADSGLARIEASLPPDKVRDLRRFLDCLWIGPLAPQVDLSDLGQTDPDLLEAVEEGFLEQRRLRFQYRDAQGRETERYVEPHAMLILPPLWYLVAWDPARADFRHFRMDRIRAPRCDGGERFTRRHVPFPDDVQQVRLA